MLHYTKKKFARENIPTGKDEQLHFSPTFLLTLVKCFSLGCLQDDGLLKETSPTG